MPPRNDSVTVGDVVRLYVDEKMSLKGVAKALRTAEPSVTLRLQEAGIRRRTLSEANIAAYEAGRGRRADPKYTVNGYQLVRMPGHRLANKHGCVMRSRLVWEETHGRLLDGWHVHHLNGIKDDDRPENLAAMPSRKHADMIPALHRRVQQLEEELEKLRGGPMQCESS